MGLAAPQWDNDVFRKLPPVDHFSRPKWLSRHDYASGYFVTCKVKAGASRIFFAINDAFH